MSIKAALDQQKENYVTAVPEDVQSTIFQHVQELQQSDLVSGLKEGATAPNFTLPDPLGGQVTLYDELAKGPVILTFYRGSWCPFCNIQLRGYQQALPEFEKLGGQLIAISPQSPDNSLTQKEKDELEFKVLSDADGQVTDQYGILYELPDNIQDIYTGTFGLDLTVFNNTERWILPVPATFIIDREGIVRLSHVDADYTNRLDIQDILNVLHDIKTK
ncbi:peroxiredoxin-like family protein [Paenibacillus sp. GCM10012306]|uniref:peroxiredoxin-like family protein n=1 Tax=Paenibacillus sp. GCM10012306 TaxID=3317342 RepID=UPI0036146781